MILSSSASFPALAERTLPVSPSHAEGFGRNLPALLVDVARVAETVLQGTHGRRRVGLGESFWQFRPYQQGDAVAAIDWRQSARSDRLFIRETEREAAQSVYLWRDSSASMDYASQDKLPTKRQRVDLLLLTLASLLLRGGERVGLLAENPFPPVTGPSALETLARRLDAIAKPQDLPPAQKLNRYATIVAFGDFLGPLRDIGNAVEKLAAQGAQGIMVQSLDPAEITLPFTGRVRFTGSENEAAELVPRAEMLQAEYRNRLAAQQAGLERIARQAGWTLCLDRTDRTPLQALIELYRVIGGDA